MHKNFFYKNRFLFLLIGISILLKIFTHQMVGVGGGDTFDTWMSAKRLLYGLPYEWMHRTVRFGAIFPVFITQLLFSTHPVVYYVAPFLFSILQVIFLFKIGSKIKGEIFGFWVTFCFMIFPEILVCSSHPRISTFSLGYILIFLYYLILFFENYDLKKINYNYFFLSVFFFFMAYLNKEVNLFFLPTILIYIWYHTKKFKLSFYFGASLLGGFLLETFVYFLISPLPYGRLQAIFGTHMQQERLVPVGSIWNLFDRFASPHMETYWLMFILVFLASFLIIFLKKNTDKRIRFFSFLVLGFLFFMTFLVKSLDPLVPINTFRTRYLAKTVPLMMLCIGYALHLILTGLKEKKLFNKIKINLAFAHRLIPVSLLLFLTILGFQLQYKKQFYKTQQNYNYFSVFPIKETFRNNNLFQDAQKNDMPVIIRGEYQKNRDYYSRYLRVKKYLDQGFSEEESFIKSGVPREAYEFGMKEASRIQYEGLPVINYLFLDLRNSLAKTFSLCPLEGYSVPIASLSFSACEETTEKIKGYLISPENKVLLFSHKPIGFREIKVIELWEKQN